MLTTTQLLLNGFVAFVVLPICISSLIRGPVAPGGILRKLVVAEPMLHYAQDAFLIAFSLKCVSNLALHFGVASPEAIARLSPGLDAAFYATFALFIAMLIKAGLKLWLLPDRAG